MRINYLWLPFLTASAVSYFFSLIGFGLLALAIFFAGVAALTRISSERNLFHLMWLIGLYVFVCCPLVIFHVVGHDFNFGLAALVLLLSGFAVKLTENRDFIQEQCSPMPHGVAKVALLGAVVVALSLVMGKAAYFYFYPAFVIVFSLSLRGETFFRGTISFLTVVGVFLFYFIFVWEGFGRLVISCWLLIPALIYIFSYNLFFSKWLFYIGASVVSVFMSMLRFANADAATILQYAMRDSTTSPYRLADEIISQGVGVGQYMGLQGILDQYLLFFIGAFPRALWEDKPLGFGALYTIDNLSEQLVAAGHSIAALFVGEHVYYLGVGAGSISAFFATFLVCVLFRLAYRLSSGTQALSIPVSLYITSFFWVGMATYSQRLQQGFLFIVVFWLMMHFLRKVSR